MVPWVIVTILGVVFGWYSGIREYAPLSAIKTKTSRTPWIWPAFQAAMTIFIAMAVEVILSFWLRNALENSDYYIIKIFRLAVENGVGIVICWPFVFTLFDKKVREAGLNSQEEYDATACKISAALLSWIVCIVLIVRLRKEFDAGYGNSSFFFNRIVMWMIAPIGEFVVFREKKNKKEWEKVKDVRNAAIRFSRKYSPVIIGLVSVLVFAIFALWCPEILMSATIYGLALIFEAIIVYNIVIRILSPSLEASKRVFIRKTRHRINKGRFGWMNYSYNNDTLIISAVNVENPKSGNECEFVELFGEMAKENCNEEEALKILEERFVSQHQYMKDVTI